MTAPARYIAVDDNHGLHIEHHNPGQPGPGEVLIAVNAAGINRPDLMQRYGLYPPPAGASPILGLEVAGTVIATGDGVSGWKSGDRVCALCNGGGYSDRVLVPASQCLPIPGALSDVEAAALPETYFTVWYNVFERGALRPGERFLVHGGSSGIGTTAITLAGAMGATVYATAGNADKCAACESLGASRAINYNEEDFVEVLKKDTEGQGIDVILDMVGGDYVQRNFEVAAIEGRIANIAFQGGFRSEVNFLPLLMKRLVLSASTLRAQSSEQKAAIANALRERVWPLLGRGELKPVIDSVYPLAAVAEAHQRMESGAHIGKIVLDLNAD